MVLGTCAMLCCSLLFTSVQYECVELNVGKAEHIKPHLPFRQHLYQTAPPEAAQCRLRSSWVNIYVC